MSRPELDCAIDDAVARIAALPQEALGRTKRAMNVAHPDYAARVTAFMERRR